MRIINLLNLYLDQSSNAYIRHCSNMIRCFQRSWNTLPVLSQYELERRNKTDKTKQKQNLKKNKKTPKNKNNYVHLMIPSNIDLWWHVVVLVNPRYAFIKMFSSCIYIVLKVHGTTANYRTILPGLGIKTGTSNYIPQILHTPLFSLGCCQGQHLPSKSNEK